MMTSTIWVWVYIRHTIKHIIVLCGGGSWKQLCSGSGRGTWWWWVLRADDVYLHRRRRRRVRHGSGAASRGARRLGHRRPGRHAAAAARRDRRPAGGRRRVIGSPCVRHRLVRLSRHLLHDADSIVITRNAWQWLPNANAPAKQVT